MYEDDGINGASHHVIIEYNFFFFYEEKDEQDSVTAAFETLRGFKYKLNIICHCEIIINFLRKHFIYPPFKAGLHNSENRGQLVEIANL